MRMFKLTSTSVVEAETADAAIGAWREHPMLHMSEVTVAEVAQPKTQEQPKTMAQKVVDTTTALVKDAAAQAGIVEKTRFCPVHQVAMQKRPSKYGQGKFYWSCPVKLDDGNYCKAKPQ